VVIAAGNAVFLDTSASIASLTLTGASTSDGVGSLTVSSMPGTYTLTITGAGGISGTSANYYGKIFAGSSSAALPRTVNWVFDFIGSGYFNCQYLNVQLYCFQPTKSVCLNGVKTGMNTLSIMDALSGCGWQAGDEIEIINAAAGSMPLNQRMIISSVGVDSIALTTQTTRAYNSNSKVILLERNIKVKVTSSASYAFYRPPTINDNYQASFGTYNCEIRQATPNNGYGVNCYCDSPYQTPFTFNGVISGFTNGIVNARGATLSGVISNTTSPRTDSAIGGGSFNSMLMAGFSSGFTRSTNDIFTGQLFGGYSGFDTVDGVCAGDVQFCSAGIFSGQVELRTATFSNNSIDIRSYYQSSIMRGYGVTLASTNQYGNATTASPYGLFIQDLGNSGVPQAGRILMANGSGYMKSEGYVIGTHGTPPASLDFVHRITYSSTYLGNTYYEWDVKGINGTPITATVYVKSAQTGMALLPTVAICNKRLEYGNSAEILASTTAADNTDWQTLTLNYTPTENCPLTVRVYAKNASGTTFFREVITETKTASGLGLTAVNLRSGITVDDITGTCNVPAASNVVSGVAVDATTGTYPTTETSKAAQLAIDQAAVVAVADSIKNDTTVLGTSGTYDFTAAVANGYSSGQSAQLAIDQAAVAAKASSIFHNATILNQAGTLKASNIGTLAGTDDLETGNLAYGVEVDDVSGNYLTADDVKAACISAIAATPVVVASNNDKMGYTLSASSLARGPEAALVDEDIETSVFRDGTTRLTARVYYDGQLIKQSDIATITYTIYELGQRPNDRVPVKGHTDVLVNAADMIWDGLISDAQASKYNFADYISTAISSPFAKAGVIYMVEYTITPKQGEIIIARFRVGCI
jgi:hypothetical protein